MGRLRRGLWVTLAVFNFGPQPGLAQSMPPAGGGDPAEAGPVEEALALLEEGQLAEARTTFTALLDSEHAATAHHHLGRMDLAEGSFDASQGHLKRAAELEQDVADHRYWLGMAYLDDLQQASVFRMRGLAGKAREALHEAVDLDPDHVDARTALGEYYMYAPGIAGGSKKRALEQATELLSRDRRAGYLLTARIHAEKGDRPMALEWFQATQRSFPHDPEALYHVGMFFQEEEMWDDAFDAFEAAATQPAAHDEAEWVRGALYQIGRTAVFSAVHVDLGIAALTEFNERFAQPVDALTAGGHWRLGMLYEMRGDRDLARAAYQSALRIDPDAEEATKGLKRLR